jgi:hypothetical protein
MWLAWLSFVIQIRSSLTFALIWQSLIRKRMWFDLVCFCTEVTGTDKYQCFAGHKWNKQGPKLWISYVIYSWPVLFNIFTTISFKTFYSVNHKECFSVKGTYITNKCLTKCSYHLRIYYMHMYILYCIYGPFK